ncbi:MAG: RnfABCDGE type electron transport complex subunit B [Gammaproteobacteria bacterium]|nr:RnfABCDGE type electron transport complex subunit B [Gammaproteobacteria bacterium]NIR81845.1 RnfABCDGE type electron transport complex subunit B [Gammaproteobacteria bacterium]NIR88677.1 RnfABCDGE type electron transport complex subunit B [Gammaproteobacteria bacterium]NIU02953.1 RnfABCDGE type electron transport complex subunit B [Gammaproteobacteria bacterium]NIV50474.1 RnfABCDGE type electron transport complex subunit B [Gammaproteobacteria bacterium]
MQGPSLVDRIDDLLPQTQCRRCGYEACRPYAEAVAAGEADINRCPPGGAVTMQALAQLLGKPPKPIEPACGEPKGPGAAIIDEQACIGCTICIQACPVDAIVGAVGQMHTVISAECTGCELCVEPCPVDCIRMVQVPALVGEVRRRRAAVARRRYRARQERLRRECYRARRKQGERSKKAVIAAAVARVQARRAARRRA